jgi:hypothetical protein
LDFAFNSVQSAQQTAAEFLKKRKNTAKANVSSVEQSNEIRVIHGTCPIDLEGHPQAENSKSLWTQKKGRVNKLRADVVLFKSLYFSLLVLENEVIFSLSVSESVFCTCGYRKIFVLVQLKSGIPSV